MRVPLAILAATLLFGAPAMARAPTVTKTATGVRPALDEICARTQAQAEEPAFLHRMVDRYGFEPDGEQFRYMGDDGELIVQFVSEGCTFVITGDAKMVAEADRQLQAWAAGQRLTDQVTDQTTSGEDGRRIDRERTRRGKLRLTWQVFDDFNGRDKPSRLEGVYSTHTH